MSRLGNLEKSLRSTPSIISSSKSVCTSVCRRLCFPFRQASCKVQQSVGRRMLSVRLIWHPTIDWSSMPTTPILSFRPSTSRRAPPSSTMSSSGLQSIMSEKTAANATEIVFMDPRRRRSSVLSDSVLDLFLCGDWIFEHFDIGIFEKVFWLQIKLQLISISLFGGCIDDFWRWLQPVGCSSVLGRWLVGLSGKRLVNKSQKFLIVYDILLWVRMLHYLLYQLKSWKYLWERSNSLLSSHWYNTRLHV